MCWGKILVGGVKCKKDDLIYNLKVFYNDLIYNFELWFIYWVLLI